MDYSTDSLTQRTACKLKPSHLTGGGADQGAAAERRKNTTYKPIIW
jgi:hypothetical protein